MIEGMRRQLRTYGNDIQRQYKGSKEGYTIPDMMMNYAEETQTDLITRALRAAGIRPNDLVMIHFSPDCTSNTIINHMERTQGRGRGLHANLPREDDETITTIVRAILKYKLMTRNRMTYTLEQPEGSALATHPILEALGPPTVLHQCCYNQKHCKPTLLWTNLYPRYWKPRPFQKGKCTHCKACNKGVRHEQRLMRRGPEDVTFKPPSMPGFGAEAMRNRINPNLGEILARAAVRKWNEERE